MKSKKYFIYFLFIILLNSIYAYTPPANSPLADKEHPRIWVTNDTLAEIKTKLGTGGISHTDFKTWVSWLDSKYNEPFVFDNAMYNSANFAFLWLTYPVNGVSYGHTKDEYGAKAKELTLQITNTPGGVGFYSYPFTIAYDWINPLLSQNEKVQIVTKFKTIDEGISNYEKNPQNSNIAVGRAQKIISAITFAYDGIDDAWANEALNKYHTYFRGPIGVSRWESEYNGDEGGYSEGFSYGLGYTMFHVIPAEEAWRTSNGISKEAHYGGQDTSWYRYLPSNFAYEVMPQSFPGTTNKWIFWKTQAMYAAESPMSTSWSIVPAFALKSISNMYSTIDPDQAALAEWLLANRVNQPHEFIYLRSWLLPKFILSSNTLVAPKNPAEILPLSKQHTHGWFVFRTGWNSPDDSYLTFFPNKWLLAGGTYDPLFAGSFTIDRKGPQIITQGHAIHDNCVAKTCKNILIFPDRSVNKNTGSYDDEGGHRIFPAGNLRGGIDDLIEGTWIDTRDEVRFLPANLTLGNDVDYAYADVTRAYSSTLYKDSYNPARISRNTRQFVYFRPQIPAIDSDRVIVFDRAMTTDTKFEKNWLLHTSGEPLINGVENPGPMRNGTIEGKWTYTLATEVTSTNTAYGSNGKVYLTPLLPENRKIVKVGGPNSFGQSWQTSDLANPSHEWETAYGVPVLDKIPSDQIEQYAGEYRIEIIPSTPSLYDSFLNVIEVGDAGFSKSPTALLQGNSLVGARTGNRIAMFSRLEQNITSGDFTIDQAGTYKVLVADLFPFSEYRIQYGSSTIIRSSSHAGTIYLDITASSNILVSLQATGITNPPPAISFSASQTTINQGQSTMLSWTTAGATSVSIDQGIGTVALSGTRSVSPSATTTYTITATNSIGTTTSSITINVATPSTPMINSFTASPSTITSGQTSLLSWSIDLANSISIDNGIGPVALSGTRLVSPLLTTIYTLTATNSFGSSTKTATINLNTALNSTEIWVDDAIPLGWAYRSGSDMWNFTTSNPTPYSGTSSHVSSLMPGFHHHYLTTLNYAIPINTGDKIFTYVYLDPVNPPREIILEFYTNEKIWEHRAYWGANLYTAGTDGTESRRYIGQLPQSGQWVKLELPASQVELEGKSILGIRYALYEGKAAWDYSGKEPSIITSIEGDINRDGFVNLFDIQVIVNDFGKTSGFNPSVDLSSFGIIDIFDVMVVVRNWGRAN